MKRYRLTENRLRGMIHEAVRKSLLEDINYKKGVQFINEGMVMPHEIVNVWVSNKSDDCFIIKGGDGYYYDVYPSYHDSYRVDSDSDKYIESIGKKVEQAFSNHNIGALTHVYDGYLIIEIRDPEYDGEFDKPLETWLTRNGFTLDRYDDMYNEYWYTYNDNSSFISDERLQKKLSGYRDITSDILPYLTGDPISDGRNLTQYYKRSQRGVINLE